MKAGVEWVKTYPTGDAAAPDVNDHHTLCMTFDEMHAVVATAQPAAPPVHQRPTGYVCRGFVCERPVTSAADLAAQLGRPRG